MRYSVAIAIYYALSAQLANRLLGVSWSQFVRIHGPGLASAAVLWLTLRLVEPFISEAGSAVVELCVKLTLAAAVLALLYTLVPARFLGTEALDILKATADGLKGWSPFPVRFRS